MGRYEEIDLARVKIYPASPRKSKVEFGMEAEPPRAGMRFAEFWSGLPDVLKVRELRALVAAVAAARDKQKPVLAMLGGHVIKCGCAPVLLDLVQAGFVTHIAANGSVAVHDTELTLFGHTSENVEEQLADGSFGMAGETGETVNLAAVKARREHKGFGEALGEGLSQKGGGSEHRSLLAGCFEQRVPLTLHVALGTDIVHQQPTADGASIGEASFRDFRILTATVCRLGGGGVVLNFGSAVIMPEVFLKALSVARNLGCAVRDLTTANFDMLQQYRPHCNVVTRPVLQGGQGYSLTGHHEFMIPLFAAALHEAASGRAL